MITRFAMKLSFTFLATLFASGLAAQDGDATGEQVVPVACVGCKSDFKRPDTSTPPQSASGSWSLRRIVGWNRLIAQDGTCGPITPGPGCQIGRKCRLTTTGGTFSMQLVSRHAGSGGTTGPNPGAGWGLPGQTSPLEWDFSVSNQNPKEVNCNGKLDLSIKWKQNGTDHVWEFFLKCSKCPNAAGNDPDPVTPVGTVGD